MAVLLDNATSPAADQTALTQTPFSVLTKPGWLNGRCGCTLSPSVAGHMLRAFLALQVIQLLVSKVSDFWWLGLSRWLKRHLS